VRPTLLLIVLALCGCRTTSPPREVFHCGWGEAAPEEADEPGAPEGLVTTGPIGRFEIAVLGPVPNPPTNDEEAGDPEAAVLDRGLSVIAEGVPLGDVAVGLATRLGINALVQPQLAAGRVFLHAPNTPLRDVLRAIDRQLHISARLSNGSLMFRDWNAYYAEQYANEPLPPRTVRVYEINDTIAASDLARFHCEVVASRGSVATVGQTLRLTDTREAIARFEAAATRMGAITLPQDPPAELPGQDAAPDAAWPAAFREDPGFVTLPSSSPASRSWPAPRRDLPARRCSCATRHSSPPRDLRHEWSSPTIRLVGWRWSHSRPRSPSRRPRRVLPEAARARSNALLEGRSRSSRRTLRLGRSRSPWQGHSTPTCGSSRNSSKLESRW